MIEVGEGKPLVLLEHETNSPSPPLSFHSLDMVQTPIERLALLESVQRSVLALDVADERPDLQRAAGHALHQFGGGQWR